MSDIFDIKNTEDLPHSLKKAIVNRKKTEDSTKYKIVELLMLANRSLCIQEIMVSFFRMYGEEKKRGTLLMALASLVRDKKSGVYRVKHGVYAIKK